LHRYIVDKPIADGTYVQYCIKLQDAREQLRLAFKNGDEENMKAWAEVVGKITTRLELAKRPIPVEQEKGKVPVRVDDLTANDALDKLLDAFKEAEGEDQTKVQTLLKDKLDAIPKKDEAVTP
jgi:hypothetical protein